MNTCFCFPASADPEIAVSCFFRGPLPFTIQLTFAIQTKTETEQRKKVQHYVLGSMRKYEYALLCETCLVVYTVPAISRFNLHLQPNWGPKNTRKLRAQHYVLADMQKSRNACYCLSISASPKIAASLFFTCHVCFTTQLTLTTEQRTRECKKTQGPTLRVTWSTKMYSKQRSL